MKEYEKMEKKNRILSTIIAILVCIIFGLGGLFLGVYLAVEKQNFQDSKKDDKKEIKKEYSKEESNTKETKSILLVEGDRSSEESAKIIVGNFEVNGIEYTITAKNEDDFDVYYINNKKIWTDGPTQTLEKLYLINDILMYENCTSSGSHIIKFVNLNGKEIKELKVDNADTFIINCQVENYKDVKVEGNKITFIAARDAYSYITSEQINNNEDVTRLYEVEYLGNNNISEPRLIDSQKYSEDLCEQNDQSNTLEIYTCKIKNYQ